MKSALLHIITLIYSSLSFTQTQSSLPYIQFTTANGLPSSEVYEILQDRDGYIWFSTDNGVSRFNGYEFKNFGALEGLSDPVVFQLLEDTEGRLWMQSMSGNIFYVENDSIHAFAGNQLIEKEKNKFYGVHAMYIDSSGFVYNSKNYDGVYRVSPLGESRPIWQDSFSYCVMQVEKTAIPASGENPANQGRHLAQNPAREIQRPLTLILPQGRFQHSMKTLLRNTTIDCKLLRDNSLLVQFCGFLCLFRQGRLIWQIPFKERISAWYEDENGHLQLGLDLAGGIRKYHSIKDLESGHYQTLLKGYSISHIMKDRDGGFWFATIEAGVFYSPNPAIEVFDSRSGFPSDYITSLAFIRNQKWLAGIISGGLMSVDFTTKKSDLIPHNRRRTYDIAYDSRQDLIWACTPEVGYFKNEKWHLLEDYFRPSQFAAESKHFRLQPERRIMWGTYTAGFIKINLDRKAVEFDSRSIKIGGQTYLARTFDVFTTKKGRTWVGNVNGLFELKNGQLYPPGLEHPAFKVRVEAIDELPGGTLVIGSKGYGVVFWKGQEIVSVTMDDGLTANMIENLHVDESGAIWAGTLNGLNRIIWDWEQGFSVEPVTTAHGLPGNEINQVKTHNGLVWVATTDGLAKFSGITRQPKTLQPLIEKVWVNDQSIGADAFPLSFSHNKNNFSARFLSLQFQNPGKVLYRYRLQKNQPWRNTQERQLSFAALPAGEYHFEVQAQNADGLWSESSGFPFKILPAWYNTWLFRCLLLVIAIGIGYAWTQRFKRRIAIRQQINELERKALQAQMNPHFIFNCLNSIQRLMIENDTQNVIRYLNRFAKLVRGTLNTSVQGKVTLQEEVQLLTNYLELEKLRFKEKFNFKIRSEGAQDHFDLVFPPMLVQPYVENAVLHGIGKKEGSGEIHVEFRRNGAYLLAIVTDNGNGFRPENGKPNDNGQSLLPGPGQHRSVGMMLTRKRLELLNGEPANDLVEIEELKDETGQVNGTKVTVKIKLEE